MLYRTSIAIMMRGSDIMRSHGLSTFLIPILDKARDFYS